MMNTSLYKGLNNLCVRESVVLEVGSCDEASWFTGDYNGALYC